MSNENPGCLGQFLQFLGLSSQAQPTNTLPYRLRDDFLSPAELSFFHVLQTAIGERFTVCAKVRLTDIFYVLRRNENFGYVNKISSKHVDFLLCDPQSLEPQLGIELDDASHRRRARAERDEFVDEVFATAGLPLLRVPPQRSYDTEKLVRQIRQTLLMPAENGMIAEEPADADPTNTPLCPKCNIPMVLRTARRGSNRGNQFYGCPNFPKCRETKLFTS